MDKRTIKKDKYGLYITAYGDYVRPLYGTCFKDGDTIIGQQLSRWNCGTREFGVTTIGNNFKPDGIFEIWCKTNIQYHRGEKLTDETLKTYRGMYRCKMDRALKLGYHAQLSKIFEKHNKEVANSLKTNSEPEK